MWPTAVFGVSFLGLVLLFSLKALELHLNKRTPLHHVRRIGDPILIAGWTYYSTRFRKAAFTGLRVCILWLRSAIHKTETTFDSTVHAIAGHLNRYLRTRRLHIRHGSEVSAHLKTVLEKTEEDTERPHSL